MKYAIVCLAACLLFATAAFADGSTDLYAKSCKSCHGADGSKVTMGMSRSLSSMTSEEARDALKGYKAGTYGGARKSMMERAVKPLSDEDIEALAVRIGAL